MTKPSTRRYQRNQQAILETARQMIVEQGAEQLSMRKLADALDYSPSALYKYVDSKEDLLTEIALQGLQELAEVLRAASEAQGSYPQKAFATGRAYLQFADENPQLYLLMFTSQGHVTDESIVEQAPVDEAFQVMIDLFHAGIEAGAFQSRPGYGALEMAYHAWITVHGVVMLRASLTAPLAQFEDMVERILRAFVSGLSRAP